MNHNITVERFGIRLRPITMDDAEFIFKLRRSPELSKYIGEIDSRYAVHEAWLKEYFHREGDYYFCIELLSGVPIGTIAIYDIDGQAGNWGRWIISDSIPAAPASVWLIFTLRLIFWVCPVCFPIRLSRMRASFLFMITAGCREPESNAMA